MLKSLSLPSAFGPGFASARLGNKGVRSIANLTKSKLYMRRYARPHLAYRRKGLEIASVDFDRVRPAVDTMG